MAILRVKLQGFCGASATTLCSALSSNVSAAALLAGSSSRARDAAPERRCMMWALGLGPWSGPDFTLAQGNARRVRARRSQNELGANQQAVRRERDRRCE